MKIIIIVISLFVFFFSSFGYIKSKYPSLADQLFLTEIDTFFTNSNTNTTQSPTEQNAVNIVSSQHNVLYTDYSPEKIKNANKGPVVLFFFASWCPTCKSADRIFNRKIDELPAGLTLLKVDYDSELELKAKYGITKQHSFVQVDAEGNPLASWSGGAVDGLKANLIQN